MIEFGPETCGNLDLALSREWLETNGIGGYASSTIACINTRRYHGLLIAALEQPPGRFVLLSKLEATVMIGSAEFPLCANIYPGAIYPAGFQFLCRFRLCPFPIVTFEAAGRLIEKRLTMARGENTVIVEYRLIAGESCALELRPFIAFRGYHETTHENPTLLSEVEQSGNNAASVQPYPSLPRLFFSFTPGGLTPHGDWYRNFVYPRERERGLDDREDLFSPFILRLELTADEPIRLVASTAYRNQTDLRNIFDGENNRRRALQIRALAADRVSSALLEAADAFLIRRQGEACSVIAGYHWFTEWGRDTMIALPGLTLATGRFDLAKQILAVWTSSLDRGMLPNRFPDSGSAAEYNTVDASLWLFEAVRKYLEYTRDFEFVRASVFEPLLSILDWYTRGTRFGIRCDSDGLIVGGEAGSQLTWMDAMVAGRPATPRHGKPVEIQALWYNALCIAADLASLFGDQQLADELIARAAQTKASFAARFWNEGAGCLFDVIDQPGTSASIRPNQVIALSLGYRLVTGEKAIRILSVIERDLLTPFGLRTLAPSDPQYRGLYEGDVEQRDSRYHQGTVWPWLLGHFISAYVRAHNRAPEAIQRAASWLSAFESHLGDAGLGSISEIFDGDSPHKPRGCIAQAWSAAEILRVRMEEIHGIRPSAASGPAPLSS